MSYDQRIPPEILWDEHYESLHAAYNALRRTFANSGLTQDQLAAKIGVSKSRVSKCLNGSENLTLKTLSRLGTAMGYRLLVRFQPCASLAATRRSRPTSLHSSGEGKPDFGRVASAESANTAKELEPA